MFMYTAANTAPSLHVYNRIYTFLFSICTVWFDDHYDLTLRTVTEVEYT